MSRKNIFKSNGPVIAIVVSIVEGTSRVYKHGINLIVDIGNKPMTLEEVMQSLNINRRLCIERSKDI